MLGATEQGDEADEAFGGTVPRTKCRLMPAPARNRGHRFAAYRQCSADAGVKARRISQCGVAVVGLAWVSCATVPTRGPSSADVWQRQGCFSQLRGDPRELEASSLQGVVFTAGYRVSEFPVPVAVVYARRRPNGELLRVEVGPEGQFVLPDAPEGLYEVGVCANGWKPWRGTVRVRRDSSHEGLDLPLELGG